MVTECLPFDICYIVSSGLGGTVKVSELGLRLESILEGAGLVNANLSVLGQIKPKGFLVGFEVVIVSPGIYSCNAHWEGAC